MLLAVVELRDFRSYAGCELSPGPGLTVLHGPNGAGKSNLLEAICFACTGHSPRTRAERQLIRFGARSARVEVSVSDGGELHRLSVGYGPGEDGGAWVKRMRADGVVVARMSDVEARPLIGVFLPERLALMKGPPAVRRAHLDRLTAALWPLSTAERRSYARVLAQRNVLLQRIRARGLPSTHLDAWDRELARHALSSAGQSGTGAGPARRAFRRPRQQSSASPRVPPSSTSLVPGPPGSTSCWGSSARASHSIWSEASRPTAPTGTSCSYAAMVGIYARMAPRESSAWPCSPFC